MSQMPPSPSTQQEGVRPLGMNDLPAMQQIETRVYQEPWTAQVLEESLRAPMTYNLGLFQKDELIGYGIYQVILGEGHLLNLAIHDSHQNQGFGGRLLDLILKDSEARGASRFYLEVRPSNQVAQKLYSRRGFKALMIRENYYRDGEAALIMVRECSPG